MKIDFNNYNPLILIKELKKNFMDLEMAYNTKVRHYVLEKHTILVCNQFEQYFSHVVLPIDKNLFRLFLVLHDIGKPNADEKKDLSSQHTYSLIIIHKIWASLNLGFNDNELKIIDVLLSGDPLGLYFQNKLTIPETISFFEKKSKIINLSESELFNLFLIYYQCDVASYTKDAGGLYFLEKLFEYNNGKKIFDANENILKFSSLYQNKLSQLRKSFVMNIQLIKGNIFNAKTQTIVNTVNCVGVMGKGIALVFKLRYPEMYSLYKEHCKNKLIGIGKLWLYKGESNAPWVLNFPTKYDWKYPSKIEYLRKGLEKFVETYKEKGITSIAFPLLGTHNGGLNKEDVLSLMENYLSQCDIPIEIYEYDPLSADNLFETFKSKWIQIPSSELRQKTGIRTQKQVDTINSALNDDNIKSMIALVNFEGIGIKTMEKCFSLVMNPPYTEKSLFHEH